MMMAIQDHTQPKVPGELPAGHSVSGPEANAIHLWAFSVDPSSGFKERCRQALPPNELQRIDFFKFPNAKENFLISQGGLRLLLGAYLEMEPLDVRIGRQPKGKPFSLDDPNLHFNMSNSGKWVSYAVSTSGEVGIDIEYLRALPDLDQLISKNFTEKEQAYINKPGAEQLERFFKFWTLKEGYLKAIGEGMRLAPDNLEFSIDRGHFKLDSIKGFFEQDEWTFDDLKIDDEHVGTIVHKLSSPVFNKMNF